MRFILVWVVAFGFAFGGVTQAQGVQKGCSKVLNVEDQGFKTISTLARPPAGSSESGLSVVQRGSRWEEEVRSLIFDAYHSYRELCFEMDDSGQLLQLSLGHRIAKRSELYSEPARVGNIIDPQTLIGRVELQFRASLEAKVHECKNNLSTLPSNAFYWDLGLADGSSTHLYMFSFRGPTSPEELARMAGKVLQPQMKLMEKLVSNRDQVFLSYSKGMCYRKVIGVSPSSGSFCNNPITGDIPTGIEERLLKVECPLDRSRLVLEK